MGNSSAVKGNAIPETARWMGWTMVVFVLHMVEQLLVGTEELTTLQHAIASWDTLFRKTDTATVVLVTASVAALYMVLYCILKGGKSRFVALSAFNLVAISECHHLIETALSGRYSPGTVTAVPFIACGIMFQVALVKERRRAVATDVQTAPAENGSTGTGGYTLPASTFPRAETKERSVA